KPASPPPTTPTGVGEHPLTMTRPRICGRIAAMEPTPSQQTQPSSSEAAIVGRLIKPDHGDFSPEVARELLSLQFGDEDQARMRELSDKAQEGTLTASEQAEVENYRRVGYWLGILWSRARLSLKHAGKDATNE